MSHINRILLASVLATTYSFTSAQTVRIANIGDALSMDPHSLAETVQLSTLNNIYEALTTFDKNLRLVPALATSWEQVSPTVWRFHLRQGVRFHDGKPLKADDVVFSFKRATSEVSDMRPHVSTIKEVRKVDDHTVDIETKGPFPILPAAIFVIYIMNKEWSEANQAVVPVDRRKGVENAASFRANGTGPFRLKSRQPDVRTVFERNDDYWDNIESNLREIIFTPVTNDATRVAALLSGSIDVIEPVPVQDIGRINANPATQVITGPEIRTVYLGMDVSRDELLYSSVKGKNPFKDKRVRQAFYQAIDIENIKKSVMRDMSVPSALMVGAGVNGFQPDMKRLPYDPNAAKQLMIEAGYGDGFELTMNCPNDRYMNDSRICQAVAANLARIGVKISLQAETKATYFPKIFNRDTSFYLHAWTPAANDAHNALNSLIACPDGSGAGTFNLGTYCNPVVDDLIKKIQAEADPKQRDAFIRKAFEIHANDIGHLPLHQQVLMWGISNKVTIAQRADNMMLYKWISVNE